MLVDLVASVLIGMGVGAQTAWFYIPRWIGEYRNAKWESTRMIAKNTLTAFSLLSIGGLLMSIIGVLLLVFV